MKPLDEALRRADENALEAYRGMPAGSRDFDTVQCVTKAALASLAHQGWVLVPRVATDDMLATGKIAAVATYRVDQVYESMVAAAPKLGETT